MPARLIAVAVYLPARVAKAGLVLAVVSGTGVLVSSGMTVACCMAMGAAMTFMLLVMI